MNRRLLIFIISLLVGMGLPIFNGARIAHAYNYTFSDNFASDTVGLIDGQNGWSAGDASNTQGASGVWKIATSTVGNVAQWFPDSVSTYNYYLQYIANGKSTLADTRLQTDFQIPPAGAYNASPSYFNYNPQLWVRRTSATGDGGGYMAFYQANQWYLTKHLAGATNVYITLAQTTSTLSMATGTWYTGVFQAVNSATGTPVLSLWVYPQGGMQPAQPMMTIADASATFSAGFFGMGTAYLSIQYANVSVQATDVLTITSPARAVSASSSVATIAIKNSTGNTFNIPYIQTSSTLPVTASVGAPYIPSGGGVKFVLTNTSSSQTQTLYSMASSSPYSVSFTNLAKGTYTLDAYVVDSNNVVQNGLGTHDQAINIGIGDIITAIGDSITAGYPFNYTVYPAKIADWTQAHASSTTPISLDNRNYPQQDVFNLHYSTGFLPQLNDMLTAYYGYPVFIMNEGVSSYRAADYITFMTSTQWANREHALAPNKWLINLGINDANSSATPSSTFAANMQTIVSNLLNSYGATPSNIYIAKPTYPQNSSTVAALVQTYLPQIDSLVSQNHISAGANFFTYFQSYYPALYNDTLHPNNAGYVEMADLWSLPFISPQNVQASPSSRSINFTWGGMTGYNSQINGYKISYGTTSGNYTTTIDVGNVTAKTISGLGDNTPYYFTVLGYYSDPTSTTVNSTANAAEVSATTWPIPQTVSVAAGPPSRAVLPPASSSVNSSSPATTTVAIITVTSTIPTPVIKSPLFIHNLRWGDRTVDVRVLQTFLIDHRTGPAAIKLSTMGATGYFGSFTQWALMEYQKSVGITPPLGYFGPITRAFINAH